MVLEILSDSSEKLSLSEISNRLGITPREAMRIIATERRSGAPICASTTTGDSGYFRGDSNEVERQCRSLGSRIRELREVQTVMKRTAEKLRKDGG